MYSYFTILDISFAMAAMFNSDNDWQTFRLLFSFAIMFFAKKSCSIASICEEKAASTFEGLDVK